MLAEKGMNTFLEYLFVIYFIYLFICYLCDLHYELFSRFSLRHLPHSHLNLSYISNCLRSINTLILFNVILK